MQALKAAGREGLDTGALVQAVTAAGVKSWEDMRIAKSSVASSCTHDPALARLQKGRFALRTLRPDLEVSVSAQHFTPKQSLGCTQSFGGPGLGDRGMEGRAALRHKKVSCASCRLAVVSG